MWNVSLYRAVAAMQAKQSKQELAEGAPKSGSVLPGQRERWSDLLLACYPAAGGSSELGERGSPAFAKKTWFGQTKSLVGWWMRSRELWRKLALANGTNRAPSLSTSTEGKAPCHGARRRRRRQLASPWMDGSGLRVCLSQGSHPQLDRGDCAQ